MNKLLAALIAGMFALGSTAAMADDKTPAQPVDQAKLKADREAAKSAKAQMTPEEKNAAKKAKRKQKQQEEAQVEKVGNIPAGRESRQYPEWTAKGRGPEKERGRNQGRSEGAARCEGKAGSAQGND